MPVVFKCRITGSVKHAILFKLALYEESLVIAVKATVFRKCCFVYFEVII